MQRYIMSFSVPKEQQLAVEKLIHIYFNALHKQGPAGMRSQCYATDEKDCSYVHIKAFKKESVANQHFRSAIFQEYIRQLTTVCDQRPAFSRLQQQETFESIY